MLKPAFTQFQRAKFLLQRSNMLIEMEFRIVRSLQRGFIYPAELRGKI